MLNYGGLWPHNKIKNYMKALVNPDQVHDNKACFFGSQKGNMYDIILKWNTQIIESVFLLDM